MVGGVRSDRLGRGRAEKSIGSTEQNRLLLAPGHHSLTVSNKELGYTAVQEVDINGGEVTSITIDPCSAQ